MTKEGRPSDWDDVPVASMYDVPANDPDHILIDRSGVASAEVAQISEVMNALGALREAGDRLNAASQECMELGRTDMKALHFLIVEENQGQLTTAGAIAAQLHISTASTTKLLDRLARGGHIIRSPHPTDRRALVIRITPEPARPLTRQSAGSRHGGSMPRPASPRRSGGSSSTSCAT